MKVKIQLIVMAFVVAASTQVCSAGLQAPLPEFKSKEELQKIAQARQASVTPEEEAAFYTGKPYQAEREGYLFKYRSYDPELGRWTSADPSGFPDGANNCEFVGNELLNSIDTDGLQKVKVTTEIHMHDPDCFGWENAKGDGSDWITWYSGHLGFDEYLAGKNPSPTAASLATNFVGGQLGLNISGSSSSWTAYGGEIKFDIYKDTSIIPHKTVWYFDFTVNSLTSYTKSAGQAATNPHSLTPIHTSGELTSVTE